MYEYTKVKPLAARTYRSLFFYLWWVCYTMLVINFIVYFYFSVFHATDHLQTSHSEILQVRKILKFVPLLSGLDGFRMSDTELIPGWIFGQNLLVTLRLNLESTLSVLLDLCCSKDGYWHPPAKSPEWSKIKTNKREFQKWRRQRQEQRHISTILIGWMRKNSRAARAARFLVQFFDVICQTKSLNFHMWGYDDNVSLQQ